MLNEIKNGHQVYVVAPLIEDEDGNSDLNDVIKQIHIWAGEDFIGSFQHSEDNRDMQFEMELVKEKIRTSWVEYENGLIKFISWGAEGRKTDCWWDLVDIE